MRSKSHRGEVHHHYTMVNFLLPLGLVIVAVLVGYLGQSQPALFHQYLYWLIGFGIMFAALHILVFKKKVVLHSQE